ncbi:amino acid adenylation domain-containing protein [Nonomuraea sp. NPDC049269]|uniref:amino acid adenylation domain-containing protein n=1 Tax=Nonomuraea sp. NPDC049269 TaxID=3364349 RepID=UPI00371DC098
MVGLHVGRTPQLIIAILAVWKAGAAYLPLDAAYPAGRLAHMLADSRATLLLTDNPATTPTAELDPDSRVRVVVLSELASTLDSYPGHAPQVVVEPDQGAYLIYTSGSTGRPKGVLATHCGAINLATVMRPVFAIGPDDTVLQFASHSFDAAVLDLAVTLTTGATLALATTHERANPQHLTHLINQQHITAASIVPSLLATLTPATLPTLHTLILGAERLTAPLTNAWTPHQRLINTYGPTETTVITTTTPPLTTAAINADPAIGTPLPNTTTHVLNPHLHPTPIGVPGELFIGGQALARGYHHRPALTAERFIADPHAGDGSRLYRTGDLATWRPDGQLDFLGRTDHQIKIRGHRIEPGEIQHALTSHPHIAAALVTPTGQDTDRRLIAYLVPADPAHGTPTTDDLRTHLATRLPDYMIPSVFIELAAFPLSPNGKIDRAALPAPDGSRPDLTDSYQPPTTPTEQLLADIWTDLLGLDRIGVRDNFFDLGGHSLLATQVITRIRAVLGVDLPLAALFDQPSVAGLAPLVDGANGSSRPPILPADRDQPLPLSFAQQRLWFLAQLDPDSAEYNTPTPIPLPGDLDIPALRAALTALTERHEVLRTRLVADPHGIPHQIIDPPTAFDLPVVEAASEQQAQTLIAADAATPFDLAAGPLLRGTLIRLADDLHILALCMHHVISDEWSAKIFHRELTALYEAFRTGRPSPLAPLRVQYADFALWQRDWLTGETLENQLGYWRRRLAGPPVLDLPTDRPRAAVRDAAGAAITFHIEPETTAALKELSRRSGATMFMTVLAAYTVLLGRYTRQDDVLVGTRIANRNQAETEDLIGFFINTLVLRTDLSGDPTFTDLLHQVRTTALDAYGHQDLPFEQVVDELGIERDRSRPLLFQTLLNYFTADDPVPLDQAGTAEVRSQDAIVAKYDLQLFFTEDNAGGVTVSAQFSTALFDRSTIERLIGHLHTLLAAIATDPDRPVSGLPILTPEERRLAETGWGAETAEVRAAGGVHELISGAAAAGDVALVSGTASMTYAELERQANRLAHHLIDLGAGPEKVVGLCLDRGAEMIVAILAVWKAGAAYLPLDPAHPAERLAYLLGDSGATVIVATGAMPPVGTGAMSPVGTGPMPLTSTIVVALDDPVTRSQIEARPESAPEVATVPGQAAYLIYTSGSTGKPKGVVVTHGNLVNYLTVVKERTGLGGRGESYALLQSVVTDFGNTTVFVSLTTGGTLHLPLPEVVDEPERVAAYLASHRIDHLKIVPSHLAALTQVVPAGRLLPARTLVLGGEAATPEQITELLAEADGRSVVNHYGPTETTIGTATIRLDAGHIAGGTVPIGTALPNTRLYVLDDALNPVPAGVPGELSVGGAGVARGYLGRPALTAERFVADPFAGDGSRLYRTGDQARRRPDGVVDFLGRTDHQVKIRGFRVEPAEVQHVLGGHPAVAAALVTAYGEAHDRRLAAYLIPADAARGVPPVAVLRAHLSVDLPDHMIPSVFIPMTAFPLTSNGKLDRAALPSPEAARPEQRDTHREPATPAEVAIAGIWARSLGLPQVGVTDDFFELGGHSLQVIQVVSQIRKAGYALGVADFFTQPTVAGLAELVAEPADTARPRLRSAVRLKPGTAEPALFFVHAATGGVAELAELAGRLGPDQQFYGLQARGLDGSEPPLETVAEMAAAYLDEVTTVQPSGSYLFAGWSVGGYIAVEMARQAAARGLEVGGVYLVGPPLHRVAAGRVAARKEGKERDLVRDLLTQLDQVIAGGPGTRLAAGPQKRLLERWQVEGPLLEAVKAGDTEALRVGRMVITHLGAVLRHRADPPLTPYEGRVVLFIPQDDPADVRRKVVVQWRDELAAEPEIEYVPGEHGTVVRGRGAEMLAIWLRSEIVRRSNPSTREARAQ